MNVFNKYVWLLNALRRKGSATLEELQEEWDNTGLNVDHTTLNARTFGRWKNAIEDLFGIEIECDASRGYRYYIADDSNLEEDKTISWMLHAITIGNVVEEFKTERENIVLEDVPSGEKYLTTILEAIKLRCQLQLMYKSFLANEGSKEMLVNPLCVRLFERRWYAVVSYVNQSGKLCLIALDRIEKLELTGQKFERPEHFSAREFFAYDYGIGVGFGEKPTRILLKIHEEQMAYIRTLPLHFSQKEVGEEDDCTLVEYYLKPTHDFARALLPYGAKIEVIEPSFLRKRVISMTIDILNNYNKRKNG